MKPLHLATVGLLVAGGLTAAAVAASPVSAAATAAACASMTTPVHQRVARDTGDSTFTTPAGADVSPASADGALTDDGVAFLAAARAGTGTAGVHLLQDRRGRHAYALDPADVATWTGRGYADRGVVFAAAADPGGCLRPVYQVVDTAAGTQRLAVTPGSRDELLAGGWQRAGIAFYAAVDPTFSIAVIPDTQQEVIPDGGPAGRFTNRARWLANHASALDLRYITHTGDVVNWDTDDHAQYASTVPGVRVLDASGVPWSFSIGNHDTMATGPGGSARPGGNATVDQRVTTTFNSYFGVRHAADLAGTYQPGRIDNSFSTFPAGGKDWLVLNLELWPRTGVVDWAAGVIAAHPRYDVVIVTDALLNADSTIEQDNGGYGANSPQYVVDRLVDPYPNVRFVFSGHTGDFGYLQHRDAAGKPVEMIMTTYHSGSTNPVRLVDIDTAHDTYETHVYAPFTGETFTDGSAFDRTGIPF